MIKTPKVFSIIHSEFLMFPVASHCAPLRRACLCLLCALPFGICRQQQDLPFAFSSPGWTNANPSTSPHTLCAVAPKHLGPSGPTRSLPAKLVSGRSPPPCTDTWAYPNPGAGHRICLHEVPVHSLACPSLSESQSCPPQHRLLLPVWCHLPTHCPIIQVANKDNIDPEGWHCSPSASWTLYPKNGV